MEPLLAVQRLFDPRTNQPNAKLQRENAQARELHPGTGVEREEEHRFETGVGDSGAFGDHAQRGASERIERSVWEWRDEDTVLQSADIYLNKRAAGSHTRKSPGKEETPLPVGAFLTPLSKAITTPQDLQYETAAPQMPSATANIIKGGSTIYRFIDASSSGIDQDQHVKKANKDREIRRAKKAKVKLARV